MADAMDLSDVFSRIFLHHTRFGHHGPKFKTGAETSSLDLRLNQTRWVYGHSHPLYVKSLIQALEDSQPMTLAPSTELKKSNIPFEARYAFQTWAQDLYGLSGFTGLPVFFVDENLVLNQSAFELALKRMNSLKGRFVLIESNTINFDSTGSVVLAQLKQLPKFYCTNLGLPLYAVYSQQKLKCNTPLASANLTLGQNIIKYLREAIIFGPEGLIATRNQFLQTEFACTARKWTIQGTCLSLNAEQQAQVVAQEKGLLCEFKNSKLICNLPLTLKSDQLRTICNSLKELDQCSF